MECFRFSNKDHINKLLVVLKTSLKRSKYSRCFSANVSLFSAFSSGLEGDVNEKDTGEDVSSSAFSSSTFKSSSLSLDSMSERHSTTHDGFCGSVCTLEIARTVAYEGRRYAIEFSAGHVNGAVTAKLNG